MKECQLNREKRGASPSSAKSDERVPDERGREAVLNLAMSDGRVPDERERGYSLSSAMSDERAPDETRERGCSKLSDVRWKSARRTLRVFVQRDQATDDQ